MFFFVADAASPSRRQPFPCGRRTRSPDGKQESYAIDPLRGIVGLCFVCVALLLGVATCLGARRAKHKAREKALAQLLSLVEEADEASRLGMPHLERDVAWIRCADTSERLEVVQAVMPNGKLVAAMACPSGEQKDGKESAPSPSFTGPVSLAHRNDTGLYTLPSFDIVDEIAIDHAFRFEGIHLEALRQLRRRPRDRRRLEAALARLSVQDPHGMALDEIRMAALALRCIRELRELTMRLGIINWVGEGEVPRRASVGMAEMV